MVRSLLYRAARWLGDVNAVERSIETHSVKPLERRLIRRTVYRHANRLAGRVTRLLLRGK